MLSSEVCAEIDKLTLHNAEQLPVLEDEHLRRIAPRRRKFVISILKYWRYYGSFLVTLLRYTLLYHAYRIPRRTLLNARKLRWRIARRTVLKVPEDEFRNADRLLGIYGHQKSRKLLGQLKADWHAHLMGSVSTGLRAEILNSERVLREAGCLLAASTLGHLAQTPREVATEHWMLDTTPAPKAVSAIESIGCTKAADWLRTRKSSITERFPPVKELRRSIRHLRR